MWILVIGLLALGVIAFIIGYFHNKNIQKKIESGELTDFPDIQQADTECCGQHATCEKDSLLAAVSKTIEYYDDEELDQYAGIEADSYSEEQVDKFKEVFYTMQETDVAGWNRSLQLRGINLPDELKEEVLLVVRELRLSPHI